MLEVHRYFDCILILRNKIIFIVVKRKLFDKKILNGFFFLLWLPGQIRKNNFVKITETVKKMQGTKAAAL